MNTKFFMRLRSYMYRHGHILILILLYVFKNKFKLINYNIAFSLLILSIIIYCNIVIEIFFRNGSAYIDQERTIVGNKIEKIYLYLKNRDDLIGKIYNMICDISRFFYWHLITFRVIWTLLLFKILVSRSFREADALVIIVIIWLICGDRRVFGFINIKLHRILFVPYDDYVKATNEKSMESTFYVQSYNDNTYGNDIVHEKFNTKEKQDKEVNIRDLGYTSKELCVYRGPFDSSSKNLALVDSKNNGSVLRGGTDILNPKVTVDDIRNGKVQIKVNNRIFDKNQRFNIYTTDGTNLIFKGTI